MSVTVSLSARPIHPATTSKDLLLMGDGVYIHITPEIARQWIGVLEGIAEGETAPKSPE